MPKIVDHERRRIEILHAAFRVIARVGFDGATLRAIAEEGGFSTGVLGYYFRNKEELLEAGMRRTTEDAYERINKQAGSVKGLRAVRAAVAEVLPDDPQLALEWAVWLSLWGRSIGADPLVKEHRLRYEEWHGLLSKLFAQAIELGEIRAGLTANTCADLVISTLYGIGVQTVINGMRPGRQRRLIDLTLRSLTATP